MNWTRLFLAGLCGFALPAALEAGAAAARFSPGSMAYVLQADGLARTKAKAIEKLAGCGRDLVVIDPSYSGGPSDKWSAADIRRIRRGRPDRKVVAYISIGEAEDYRGYWRKQWDANHDGKPDKNAPDFLLRVNPDWEGNYRVKFWKAEWQAIILQCVDEALEQGFDGLYLDIVDAFEHFERTRGKWIDNKPNPETGNTYRQDMVQWVLKIASHARKKRGDDFLIIPQNGSQLPAFPDYLRAIDAIGVEDLFTRGDKRLRKSAWEFRLKRIKKAGEAGKPVLLIEYCRKTRARKRSINGAKRNGLILLLTDRALKTLGTAAWPKQ